MRFLADMGVSLTVTKWLESGAHDDSHLGNLGLQRLVDQGIFDKALAENRIILTWDLDFGEIVAFSRRKPVSVILFRLNNTTSTFVIQRLSVVLADAEAALISGAIVVVEDARHRIRRLPLGS
jgi:predicted nuclease of predicted toxin-antitoxin system